MTDDHYSNDGAGHNSPAASSTGAQHERFDELLTALADTRRRQILHYLQDEEQASLADAAQHVAAWQQDCPPTEVEDESIADVKVALYHNHLPRLRETGIVEYDERSQQLVFRDPPDLVEVCLEHCAQQERSD